MKAKRITKKKTALTAPPKAPALSSPAMLTELRYGSVETREKYYLTWKEESTVENLLDRGLIQLCGKARFLELIHDFIVFDAGTKKLCRHNQYFGVRASQAYVKRSEGGIIWHTQGSGKSLTMVWLTKWIRENVKDARVLIITDRTELDRQIEGVFKGVNEDIYRTKSGADLIAKLNDTTPWLLCSLIHKFGGKDDDGEKDADVPGYVEEVKKALPPGFRPKGNLFVYVDECHRTNSGDLHDAMKAILPGAVFIGFTGTPLLKDDKKRSIKIFGGYIHTYKFDEAVKDKVVLDLRYEAREIDQELTSQKKIDEWFELKTKGLTDLAKAQLKQRWGTMQKVLSSRSRLENIVADILMDMEKCDRLKSGRGNAMLVAGSIYEACRFFDLFDKTDLHGKCAIITSYIPSTANIRGEETGETSMEIHIRPDATVDQRVEVLRQWYRQQLRELIPPLLEKWEKALGVCAAEWGIKKMKTKWGSCNSAARRIWLNLELAKKPVQCLEYVLAHELAHLIERHHNDRFIAILDKHLPQWRVSRGELNAAPLRNETWGG